MTLIKSAASFRASHDDSLSCRYLLMHFETTMLRVQDGAREQPLPLHWALGVAADGSLQVVGAWLPSGGGSQGWREVFGDLQQRGVVAIRCATNTGAAQAQAAFPGVSVLTAVGPLLQRCVDALPPPERHAALNAWTTLCRASNVGAAAAALQHLADGDWGSRYAGALAQWRPVLAQLAPFYALAPSVRHSVLKADGTAQAIQAQLKRLLRQRRPPARSDAAWFLASAVQRCQQQLAVGTGMIAACPPLPPPPPSHSPAPPPTAAASSACPPPWSASSSTTC